MKKVLVNGMPEDWVPTLAELIQALSLESAIVATAVNGTFIPAARRQDCTLESGDKIEILAPMQGG